MTDLFTSSNIPGAIVTYVGRTFNEPVDFNLHRFKEFFASRRLSDPITIDLFEFKTYGVDITPYIRNLGWEFLMHYPPLAACPLPVRMFYANLDCQGITTRKLTTLVNGYFISLTAEAIGSLLNFPTGGPLPLAHEDEFLFYDFDHVIEYSRIAQRPVAAHETVTTADLNPSLRTLHYLITHFFLPRSSCHHIVTKIDLWILSNALTGRKIDYCQLLFGSIVRSAEAHLGGRLPYGGLISLLISNLGISLDGFSTVETSVSIPALAVLSYIRIDPLTSKGGETLLDPAAKRPKPFSKLSSKTRKLGESSSSVCKNLIIDFEEEEAELEPESLSEKYIKLFAEDLEKELMDGEGVPATQGEDAATLKESTDYQEDQTQG
ncbi:unnamed protein product [Linum trigynum]|uniref:Putative plant transposon protein domain-containing protein n=1 Tax=Linum trigynum TaxID=586398 RepID=A0AAV2EAE0_9ROSI